jgi:dTDP-4-amino-4,6-dideoxygalactose transaminase
MPAVNFISSYNICKFMGAKIFLADVDQYTGQMTPESLENCIKKNNLKNIKVVITMYLGGYPENVIKFYKIKKKYSFLIIEDACHSLGASYRHNSKYYKVGSCKHSDICVFSLHPLKTITSGEGGLALTNSKKININLRKFRSHGIVRNSKKHWDYNIDNPGLNYRLSDINCALGLSQLKKMDKFINYRKKIYKLYKKLFDKFSYVDFPNYSKNNLPSYHLAIINLKLNKYSVKENLLKYLKKNRILAQFHYIPLYKFNLCLDKQKLSLSEEYYKRTISIPIYFNIKISEVRKVVQVITQFFDKDIYKKKLHDFKK